MKIGAKFAFVDFVDFFVDFLPKTGKNPQMDFPGALLCCAGVLLFFASPSLLSCFLRKRETRDERREMTPPTIRNDADREQDERQLSRHANTSSSFII